MTQRSGRGQLRLRMAVLAALSVLALLSGATPREVQAQGWADVAIIDVDYQAGSIRHFGRSEAREARSGLGRAPVPRSCVMRHASAPIDAH